MFGTELRPVEARTQETVAFVEGSWLPRRMPSRYTDGGSAFGSAPGVCCVCVPLGLCPACVACVPRFGACCVACPRHPVCLFAHSNPAPIVISPAGPSDRDRVLDATDIVALIGESVQLRPKGREHVGLCPFHNDRTPSLAVVSHKGSGFYKCFSCGAAGNAIDFMINYHRMDFPEALRHLAQRAGIELQSSPRPSGSSEERADSPSSLRRANEAAQRFFRRSLEGDAGAAARAAVAGRGISPEMAERFGLGVAPAGGDALVQ